jgi:hypothetical protein
MESHAAYVAPTWTLEALHQHLQAAVDLELWTIPFYMSVLYSLEEPAYEAFALVLSVVNQEMLHLQAAANLSNAYGHEVRITPPRYVGTRIPHLDFALEPFLTEGYVPLRKSDLPDVEPGDTSKFMSVPWHTDYNSCATHNPDPNPVNNTTLFWSWPAQRPVAVHVAEARR